jgi:SNF family Na+-dependent transporter
LPTCTYGGDYIVNLMNEIAVAPALLFVVFIECIAVSWFYGVNRFSNDIKAMIGSRPSLFWRSIWYLISPMFLLVSNSIKNIYIFLYKNII